MDPTVSATAISDYLGGPAIHTPFTHLVLTMCELCAIPVRMFTREQAKVTLKRKGWSYRSAAQVLGITYQHLSCVLNGQRDSRRVLVAIATLPERRRAA